VEEFGIFMAFARGNTGREIIAYGIDGYPVTTIVDAVYKRSETSRSVELQLG
jgi:hypothetical protein